VIRVDKRQLGQLTKKLGEGGMATVYRVDTPVPRLPAPLAFKELRPEKTGSERDDLLAAMRKAVELRDILPPAELADLDSLTAWPLAMVEERGDDVGLLMRLIDDDFFIHTNPPGGTPDRRVFEFQLLSASAAQVQALGIDRSEADDDLVRLALMARLAYVIELIHRPRGTQRLVYGDLNLRNAAVATNPPRILLMDCDGVADQSDPARRQPNTLFFVPPELKNKQQKLQDQATDVYKLGLCVIRGLATGKGATQVDDPTSPVMIPGLLDPEGIDLLKRAVDADRAKRPTAEDIKDYLVGRVLALAQPPELLAASLGRTVTIRGSDTLVLWQHRHATKVRIHGVNGFEVGDIEPDAHPGGYAIRPPTAGPIYVEVGNKHGSDELLAGYLDYFEPPAFDLTRQLGGLLPRLAVPDLPKVEVPEAPVPRVEVPPVDSYVNLGPLVPDTSLGAAGPRAAIARMHREAGEGVTAVLEDGVQQLLQAARKKLERLTP
jgi:hypothetical protein